jgi:hypothetical protein
MSSTLTGAPLPLIILPSRPAPSGGLPAARGKEAPRPIVLRAVAYSVSLRYSVGSRDGSASMSARTS